MQVELHTRTTRELMSTGIAELDAVLKGLSKTFNKDMFGENYGNVEVLPSGSLILDRALGVGGYPRGRLIEFFGSESSGKTSLALLAISQAQRVRKQAGIENKRDLLVDLEHTLTLDFLESFGIDVEQCIWKRPDTAEEALQLCIDLPKTRAIDTVLLDSVDSLVTASQLEKNVGDPQQLGSTAKELNFAVRQIAKLASKTNTTFFLINQIRDSLNPYGPSKVTSGGRAIPFYSSLRLELKKAKPSPDIPDALRLRIEMVKTKLAKPYVGEINIDFIYSRGPDLISDVIALSKELRLVRFAGPTVQFLQPGGNGGSDYVTITKGGFTGLYQYLQENPEVLQELKCKCMQTQPVTSS